MMTYESRCHDAITSSAATTIYLPINFVKLSISIKPPSIYPSIHLSIHPSIHLSIHLPIYPSTSLILSLSIFCLIFSLLLQHCVSSLLLLSNSTLANLNISLTYFNVSFHIGSFVGSSSYCCFCFLFFLLTDASMPQRSYQGPQVFLSRSDSRLSLVLGNSVFSGML